MEQVGETDKCVEYVRSLELRIEATHQLSQQSGFPVPGSPVITIRPLRDSNPSARVAKASR